MSPSLNPFGSDDPEDDPEGPAPGKAESSPEEARAAAEDALARIEALADLDENPEENSGEEEPSTGGASATADPSSPTSDASGAEPSAAGDDVGRGPREDQCENCGALLDGPYCSQCGQKAADRIVPLWHMVNEALEAVFELDLRVLHTFPKFVFLPGRLTKEYINGRRKRYIRPFRLYLFATFLLFTVLALTTSGGIGLPFPPATATVPADTAQAAPASMAAGVGARAADSAAADTSVADTTGPNALRMRSGESTVFGRQEQRNELADEIEKDSSQFQVNLFEDPAANERLERILREKSAQTIRNPWEFVESMIDRGPYIMFLMLPIFALLLKLLYIRRGRLYVEHMIFSLHAHAHAFFAFTVGILLAQSDVEWLNTAAIFVELSPLLYVLLAMRHVYEQGIIKTTLKAFLLFTMYSIVLSFGLLVLLLLALFLM